MNEDCKWTLSQGLEILQPTLNCKSLVTLNEDYTCHTISNPGSIITTFIKLNIKDGYSYQKNDITYIIEWGCLNKVN